MKTLLNALLFTIAAYTFSYAQKTDYQLSSHILDVAKGEPASGVSIKLEKMNEQTQTWSLVDQKVTDKNGRITDFLPANAANPGIYRLTYLVEPYFKKSKVESFYPFVEVVFRLKGTSHYHVPITLSAYGYSTYRGN
ncbi:hydroxyisourate hydrolase [Fibrella sp. HMF5335]|uniref:5-hydroxyisourate hydrolase n=1 Tax=Fibrella rubiginis TaxID=2817060 RepID=A0A939K5E7_9BACT|nr:hydroxyisourate hydrolase [Fibrella rubiginis]MBO0936385.1 hydroxyisourate hydrolase [Fibrella rubiginis]